MALWHQYPWTNFNELNLDWILKIIKEIKTVDLPALDDKIDNVYEYIKENLPEIIQQLASVIIDVKTVGAVGDGITDDSDAVRQALTMGNIIYFPEGTYRFKDIETNKPIYIFGDGNKTVFTPIRRNDSSSQWFSMINAKDSIEISDVKITSLDLPSTQTGTRYYQTAIIRAVNVDHVHMERLTIENIFQPYFASVLVPIFIDLDERDGMLLYTHNCNSVCITDCVFHDFGGDELIYITQDRTNYNNGIVKVTHNLFSDRYSGLKGSCFNILGSNVIFSDNTGHDFNNIYSDNTGGSLFNILGSETLFANNTFYNCNCGNYVDFVEGWFNKSTSVVMSGNYLNGKTAGSIKFCAEKVVIKNNYINGGQGIRTLGTSTPWTYVPAAGPSFEVIPFCPDQSTVYTKFDTVDISGNIIIMSEPAYSFSTIQVNTAYADTAPSAAQAIKYNNISIHDNTFIHDSDAICAGVIYFNNPVSKVSVSNNNFIGAGVSIPAYNNVSETIDNITYIINSYRSIISGNGGVDELIVNNNIINSSEYDFSTDGICLVTGSGTFRAATKYHIVYNTGLGHTRDHSGAVSSLGGFHHAYNDLTFEAP